MTDITEKSFEELSKRLREIQDRTGMKPWYGKREGVPRNEFDKLIEEERQIEEELARRGFGYYQRKLQNQP